MPIRATRLMRGLLLFGAGAALTTPLQAQVVEVRPVARVSFPTRFALRDGTLHVSQKVGLAFGARMILTFSNRFDITNAITYSPGSATLYGGGKKFELRSASQSLAGAASARYWLRPPLPGRQFSWEVHSGLGIVFGGQPSYIDLLDGSTLSAILGTAFKYQVGQLVSFTLWLQQRLVRFTFGDHQDGGSRPFNVAFAIGLPILERLK